MAGSSQLVKELREKTGAGILDCQKALTENGNDVDKAIDYLRQKGLAAAAKKAGRETNQGLIHSYIHMGGKIGVLIEINCETDFVAKNAEFLDFAATLAELVAVRQPADVGALSSLPLRGATVEETRKALVGKIGENVTVRRFTRMSAQGRLASYVHGGSRIGVLVDVVGGEETLGKDLAMHIAASKPLALSAAAVPAELVQKERAIASAKAAESGKPANIVEKMVEGSVQKFLKEVTLLGQPFVKDDKLNVEQLLKSRKASVASFALYVVGEGLEKRKDDFVSEVMAQVSQAV